MPNCRPSIQFFSALTRRACLAALVGTTYAFLVSCGGGGGGTSSGAAGSSATGTVVLPPNFPLPISRLAVSTEEGDVPIAANGAFSAKVGSTGPRIVQLVDTKTNKIVMLGLADSASSGSPFANGHGQVSAASTADALLFIGLEGGVFPTDKWTNFLTVIHGSTQEAQVATVVAKSVAANPTAISDGDPAIQSAVGAIQATYTRPALAAPHVVSAPMSVQRVVVTRSSTGALVNVSPNTPQSTLVVAPNPKGDGIVAVSHSRRRCVLFIYEVATGSTASKTTRLNPIRQVASDVDVEPEREIGFFFTSIFEGLQGKFDYLPVTSPPIVLSPDPIQEVAVYDVVAIGAGATDTFPHVESVVAPGDESEQLALDAEWTPARTKVYLSVVCKDIVIPTLSELLLGAGEAADAEGDAETVTEVEEIAETLPDFMAAIAARDVKGAIAAFTADIEKDKAGIRTKVFDALARTLVSQGHIPAATFQSALQRLTSAVSVIGIINKTFLVADITQAVNDNNDYNSADVWMANVLQPKVTLSPQTATISTENNIANFQTAIQNVTDLSQFRFQWSTSGIQGHLEEPFSSTAMPTGPTTFSQVSYVADLSKLKNGVSDSIKVVVFAASDLSNPIGTATATATDGEGLETAGVTFDGTTTFTAPKDSTTGSTWNESNVTTFPLVAGATNYVIHPGPGTNTASTALGGFWRYNSKSNTMTIDGLHGELIAWPAFIVSGNSVELALDGENSSTDPTGALLKLFALQRAGVVVNISYQ